MENPFPPFDPYGDDQENAHAEDKPLRLSDFSLRQLFPNLLTLLAICSGLTSIRFAIEERVELAVAAIIFAGFLDGIDGRVARFLKSSTRFGAEMDSLADFVNFGVAPALLLYFILLKEFPSIGWIVALIYAICACLRLARFNVMIDNPNQPKWQTHFFVGVPAPAGALLVLLPIYIMLLGFEPEIVYTWVTVLFTLICAFLLVSNIPTFSGKGTGEKVRSDLVLPVMILVVGMTAATISFPWQILTFIAVLYMVSIPFSIRNHRRYLAREAIAQ